LVEFTYLVLKRYLEKMQGMSTGELFDFFEIFRRIDIEKKMGIFYFDFKHAVRVRPYNVAGADVTCDIHDLRIKILSENRRISPFAVKGGNTNVFIRRPEVIQQIIYGSGIDQRLIGEQKHYSWKGIYDH
jgi:hypothetical protein